MYYAQGSRFVVFVGIKYRPIFTEYASGFFHSRSDESPMPVKEP